MNDEKNIAWHYKLDYYAGNNIDMEFSVDGIGLFSKTLR